MIKDSRGCTLKIEKKWISVSFNYHMGIHSGWILLQN